MVTRANKLEALKKTAQKCTRCVLHEKRTKVVFGIGPLNPKLMIIGEGPGENEDKQGKPFVGKSGKELDKWLNHLGLTRDQVYITNIVKCRPPENRDPTPEESYRCLAFYLYEQIKLIKPKVICTLGRPAAQSLLMTDIPITKIVNQEWQFFQTPLIPLFHPAYILRNPFIRSKVYEGLNFLKEYL